MGSSRNNQKNLAAHLKSMFKWPVEMLLVLICISCATTHFDTSLLEPLPVKKTPITPTPIAEVNNSSVAESSNKSSLSVPPTKTEKTKKKAPEKKSAHVVVPILTDQDKKNKKTKEIPNVVLGQLSSDPEWKERDEASQKLWQSFKPDFIKESEIHVMNVSYAGFSAATVVLSIQPETTIDHHPVYHFQARAKTASYYKWIYEMDDLLETFVEKKYFVPLKYSLVQDEKNKRIEDIQLFDRQHFWARYKYYKEKAGKKEKRKDKKTIPFYGQDYFSGFCFLRGLPLAVGDHYIFPTTTKAETWLMSIKVIAKEKLKIKIGEFNAIKVQVTTKYSSDFAKQGEMNFWLSDDARHIFLKSEAEVNIGSVKAELVEYRLNNQKIYYAD